MARGLTFSSSAKNNSITLPRTSRSVVLMIFISLFMSIWTARLVTLQIINGEQNRQRADENRIHWVPVPSDRGNIVDRKGRLFAANRLARSVYVWPREQTPEQWKVSVAKLSPILNLPAAEILQPIEQAGYDSTMPVRVSRDINIKTFVALSEYLPQLKGIEIRAESSRYYPNGDLAAHVLGYIGEASQNDLKKHPEYPMGMIVGQMGIERQVNKKLAGNWGNRLIEVDANGHEIRELGMSPANPGVPVQLTLDLELQKTAEKVLAKRRGGVVVLDVKTGAVLAMASGPTFDPNLFTRKISSAEWQRLQGEEKPFLNRALQGYPPGSTFKIVTATAGMESDKFDPSSILVSTAAINIGGVSFHEHGGGYGAIGFVDALAFSSNTFFYQVGMAVGPEQIAKWAKKLGLGGTTDLGLLGIDQGSYGSVPTPAEKQKLYDEAWYVGDTVTMSIGQGLVLTTPLEMAVMVATIANGGKRVKPHLLTSQTNTPATKPEPTGIQPETISTVRQGLIAVVQKGTGQGLNDGSIPLTGGKTGTAEVPGQADNSNYVAFGPANDPQIAIAVVVENGGYGAVAAAPIAQEIFKTYFQSVKSGKGQK